ncbi:hypothetical protein PMKS-002052 [Pichia membranifaciens]|uniref:Telomere-associated protein Rif1 N-terminal domain-containing protein n=1 Tax=Pichia membranifaciens TaxID=4926 RepID=A0A1Q2YGH1_9ASCO|nr:hypothetical protein PMKS-002052 [Pichia membranifaciens]
MASNEEKRQLFMRRPDDLAFSRLLRKHSSPITYAEPVDIESSDFNTSDRVKRLDKQMAKMKRKSRNGSVLGSPKQHQYNAFLGITNSSTRCSETETVILLDDDAAIATSEPVNTDSRHNKNNSQNNDQNFHQSSKNGVLSSSYSNSTTSQKPLSEKQYLSNADLLLPETQIIASISTSTTSPPLMVNDDAISNALRPFKAGSVNMFDSIPSVNVAQNDTFVELPDLKESQSSKAGHIQKRKLDSHQNQSPQKRLTPFSTYNEHLFSSSPIKRESSPRKKKKVAFSSDIESSPFTSSPVSGQSEPRSILKFTNPDLECPAVTLDDLLSKDLSQNESWPPGFVLQIPEGYPKKHKVVQCCVSGLADKQFKKQYEVYATLNDLIKRNPKIIYNPQVFSKEITKVIILSVKSNIINLALELKNGSNPFKLRTSSQSIKLISLLNPITSTFKEMSAIYDGVIKLLKNKNISKSLASSIFQLLKILPEPFFDKIDAIISSLTQMKYFLSVTVTCEKLNIMKRFVLLQPAVVKKSNYQIFSHLLYSILNTDAPGYSRVLFSAISVFTTFAKSNESNLVITKLLAEELEDSCSTIKSTSENQLEPWMTICEAICETLKYLIHLQFYSQTAKIWAYLLYMSCHGRTSFVLERWELYSQFRSVYNELYSHPQALALCLEAWKSVVYNFQNVSIKGWTDEQLKSKLNSLLFPFEHAQLRLGDGTILNQWSEYEGYLVLYCRIYYAIRLQMEIATESQMCILLHSALKPLIYLKQWDSVYSYILKMIFTSDRYIYTETVDSCFWLSDYEKWKSRILPLPKTIYKNKEAFDVILEMAWKMTEQPIEIAANFISICIYAPLEDSKLALPFRDYCKVAEMGAGLVSEIFDKNDLLIKKGDKDDAQTLFRFIENADDDLMFTPESTPLLRTLINKLQVCGNQEFITEFISLCHTHFCPVRLFAVCLSSDLYENDQLLKKDRQFPQALHYSIDITQLETENEFKLSEQEKEKIVSNIRKASHILFSHHGIDAYNILVEFLKVSRLFEILSSNLKLELFECLLDNYIFVSEDLKIFYESTPSEFFEYSLEIFDEPEKHDNEKPEIANRFVKLLSRLGNIDELPDSWIIEVGPKLGYILHPAIASSSTILAFVSGMLHRLPLKIVNKLKKMALRRKIDIIHLTKAEGKQSPIVLEGEKRDKQREDKLSGKIGENEENIVDITVEEEDSIEEDAIESHKLVSTQIISSPIEECDISFVGADEEDYKKVFQESNSTKATGDLKSFIIDSIEIDGSINENSVRVPSSPKRVNVEEGVSPARRTRSHTSGVEYEGVEYLSSPKRQKKDKKNRKEKKKEKKEKREKRRRSRSLSADLDEVSAEKVSQKQESQPQGGQGEVSKKGNPDDVADDDAKAYMDQFWKLLKKLNKTHIRIERSDKEVLETELVALLMKLKKS